MLNGMENWLRTLKQTTKGPECFSWVDVIPNLPAAGEMLHVAEPLLEKNFHPTVICRGEI